LPVLADRRALHQVVLNLLGNAIKFTAQGRVCICAEARGDELSLQVIDTGVGIDPDDQARLFQAFVQVGDWRVRRGEGTGLGLHLSRKLTELMGGTLSVRSTPGEGSCFTVVLQGAR
jgi:protein-histidine pros-kinase